MERINFELYDLENEKKLISKQYRKLLRILKDRIDTNSKKNLRHAFEMAVEAHSKTRRKSGELYIFHPIAVAQIVSEEIGLGVTSAMCALLHDTVEDTDMTVEEIQLSLGNEVAKIVEGLTKISTIIDTQSSVQIENYKKLIITLRLKKVLAQFIQTVKPIDIIRDVQEKILKFAVITQLIKIIFKMLNLQKHACYWSSKFVSGHCDISGF